MSCRKIGLSRYYILGLISVFWHTGKRHGFGLPVSAVGTAGLDLPVRYRQQELVWPNE